MVLSTIAHLLFIYSSSLLVQESFHLLVDILTGISEFLIKYLVGCREAEALHAIDTAVGADTY